MQELKTSLEASNDRPKTEEPPWKQQHDAALREAAEQEEAERMAEERDVDYSEARRLQVAEKAARELTPDEMAKLDQRELKNARERESIEAEKAQKGEAAHHYNQRLAAYNQTRSRAVQAAEYAVNLATRLDGNEQRAVGECLRANPSELQIIQWFASHIALERAASAFAKASEQLAKEADALKDELNEFARVNKIDAHL
jgi:hypothetical protein